MQGRRLAAMGIVSVLFSLTLLPALASFYAGEPAREAATCGGVEVTETGGVPQTEETTGTEQDENEMADQNEVTGPIDQGQVTQPPGYIYAEVDIKPENINLRSEGNWITAYIELPPGMNPLDIEVNTLLINKQIPAELQPVEVQDHDDDGVPDLMVKFPREALYPMVIAELELDPTYLDKPVAMTVTGGVVMVGPVTGTDWVIIRCAQWAKNPPINRIQPSIAVVTFQTPNQVGTTWWSVSAQLKNPAGVGIPNKTLKFYWRTGMHTQTGETCVSQNIGCPISIVTNAAGTAGISVGFVWGGSGTTTHVDVYFGGDCFYKPAFQNTGAINH